MDLSVFTQQLKQDADIVDIALSIGISDARYGTNICCPFHSESTPSFRFYENGNDPGSFQCFTGCGANDDGSDVFALVMQYKGVDFIEAVKTVASVTGTPMPKQEAEDPNRPLRKAVAAAHRLYSQNFASSPAQQYLQSRGISQATMEKFEFGYAAPGNRLTKYAKDLHHELIKIGLIRVNDSAGDLFDSFYNRFTIPLFNTKKQIVGFGARILDPDQKGSKYVNSQDSEIFDKTNLVFNLHRIPKKQDWCIVTEGYLDVVGLDQIGFPNAVSSMGTAITESHIRQLVGRFEEIYFMFDGDKAGLKAAWRAACIAIKFTDKPVSFRFCFLPEGTDPFDIALSEGPEVVMQYLKKGIFLSDFIIQRARSASEATGQAIEERIALINRISELTSDAPEGLFRDQISLELSSILNCKRQLRVNVYAECHSSQTSDLKNHVASKFGDSVVMTEADGGLVFSVLEPVDG